MAGGILTPRVGRLVAGSGPQPCSAHWPVPSRGPLAKPVSSSVEWKACSWSLSLRAMCAGIVLVVCCSQMRSECEEDRGGVSPLPLGSTHVAGWHPETPAPVLSFWWGWGCGQPHSPGHCPPPRTEAGRKGLVVVKATCLAASPGEEDLCSGLSWRAHGTLGPGLQGGRSRPPAQRPWRE